MRKKPGTIKRDAVKKNTHILATWIWIAMFCISNQSKGRKIYSETRRSEFRYVELEIYRKP